MILSFQDLLQTLSTVCQKSPSAELLEALATIHYADLEMAVPTNPNTPPEAMLDEVRHRYCEAQNMLLTQVDGTFLFCFANKPWW